jgi:hypothetical protein
MRNFGIPDFGKHLSWRREVLLWFGLMMTLLGLAWASERGPFFSDFPAFYCGGQLTREHLSPYLLKPLLECEQSVRIGSIYSKQLFTHVVPMPYPAYVLYFFALCSLLPPSLALMCWSAIGCASTAIVMMLLRRNAGISGILALAIVGLPAINTVIALGHPTMLLALGLTLTALAARAGNDRTAWLACAMTLMYPQCAVVACIGLGVARPRTRLPLLLCVASAGLISLGHFGVAGLIQYATIVVHDHALMSAVHPWQYGAVGLLFAGGFTPDQAIAWSRSIVFVACATAFVLTYRHFRASGDPAPMIVIPACCSIVGYYANAEHLVALVPALLVLQERQTLLRLVAATFAVWCPWAAKDSMLAILALPACAYAGFRTLSMRAAIFSAGLLLVLPLEYGSSFGLASHPVARPVLKLHAEFAESSALSGLNEMASPKDSLLYPLMKLPTWIGFLILLLSRNQSAVTLITTVSLKKTARETRSEENLSVRFEK